MTLPLRVALIGYGKAGRLLHAPLIGVEPGLDLVAVVTGNPGRAASARADRPGVHVVDRVERLWEHASELDLVVVATANVAHESLAVAALERGLHVVVDKPLARNAAAARGLVALAASHGRQLHVFMNRRWDSDFLTVRSVVEAGDLGAVHRVESRFERWRPSTRGMWRESAEPAQMGGLLYDLGPHLVDQLLLLLGPVESVYCELGSRRDPNTADDDVFVALTHESGVISHAWASSLAAHQGPRWRLLGSRGAFVVDGLDSQEARLASGELPGPGWGQEPQERWGSLLPQGTLVPAQPGEWPRFYEGVVAAVAAQGSPPVSAADAVRALEVLDAARESARTGAVTLI